MDNNLKQKYICQFMCQDVVDVGGIWMWQSKNGAVPMFYDSSWDWLIPVIKECYDVLLDCKAKLKPVSSLYLDYGIMVGTLSRIHLWVWELKITELVPDAEPSSPNIIFDIDNAFNAVHDFVRAYNEFVKNEKKYLTEKK